jgi:hypothetical protein
MEHNRLIKKRSETRIFEKLEGIFKAKTIGLIGVPPNPRTFGHRMLKNLLDFEFNGKIFLIDIHGQEV